jgi:hypothetical protein
VIARLLTIRFPNKGVINCHSEADVWTKEADLKEGSEVYSKHFVTELVNAGK